MALSESLLKKTGIDDEVIQSGENMLLTFRNIRNEQGKDNDIFNQATKAALDMSTAMEGAGFEGGNLKTTAIRLGKALNDPVRGMTALRRVGVQFTKAQEETIKKLVESGKVLDAQKLILRELNTEFGGSAEAFGKTLPGQIVKLREGFKNFTADLLSRAIPAMSDFFGWIGKIAKADDLTVRLKIASKGIVGFASEIRTALSHALFGWSEVIPDLSSNDPDVRAAAGGFATVFHDGLVQEIQRMDWGRVGRQISAGFVLTDAALSNALESILSFFRSHAQEFAEIGAEIAARIVVTLTDPAFWGRHLDLLAVLVAARFGGSLLRLFGRLGTQVAGRFLLSLVQRLAPLAVVVANIFARIPSVIRVPFEVGAKLAARAIGFVVSTLRNDLARVLNAVPGWIKAAFKVGAIVAVVGAIQSVIEKVKNLFSDLKNLVAKAWNIVVNFTVNLPGGGGGSAIRKGLSSIDPRNLDPRRHQAGGIVPMIPGARMGQDSVPALLTPGEVVLNRAQQAALGGPQVFKEMFGFAGGGVAGKRPKAPRLPASIARAKARAAGTSTVEDDVAASERELGWIDAQLKRPRLTRAQRESLQVKRINVRNRIARLKKRRKAERAKERTDLPKSLQLRIATARANNDDVALLSALKAAEAWYVSKLRRARTIDAKIALTEALDSVRGEIESLEESMKTEAAEPSADLQAQNQQLREQNAALQTAGRLREAFVATGVFAGGGGGGGQQGPGGQIIIQSLVPPDQTWIAKLAGYTAEGFGMQGFRPATTASLGV